MTGNHSSGEPAEGGLDSRKFLERVRSFFENVLPDRPDYEERPQQLEMALAVARALLGEELLVVEAGTGTGKSLAYLIPCLLWAQDRQRPVVISTRTLNLQQQLMEKDIPLLRSLVPEPFRATPARGWSNYVCLRRLQSVLNSQQSDPEVTEEAVHLSQTLALDAGGSRGRRSPPENIGAAGVRQHLRVSDPLWSVIHADSTACNRQQCTYYQECYLFRERREMESSELIIANHSLVMADLAIRQEGAQGILPRPEAWILDEGHHLEAVANEHLGRGLDLNQLHRLRANVFDPKGKANDAGWLPGLRERLARAPVPPEVRVAFLETLDRGILMALPGLYEAGEEFFHWLAQALAALGVEGRIALNSDFFHTPEGAECRSSSEVWAAHLESVDSATRSLSRALQDREIEGAEGGVADLNSLAERLKAMRSDLEFCLFPDSPDWVYWAQSTPHNTELGATPLDIGERLADDFFGPARSVVVTSATLAVGRDLSFFQQRVGLDRHQHRLAGLCLDSPFDYEECAYLGVATDLPDPNHVAFWRQSREALIWLLERLGGRTFLLTTSHASLRLARETLEEPLQRAGIRLLSQGQAPAGLLLDEFRQNSRALLMGADSFWEGVDVPGSDLSCVILTRLPFRVPSDPLVKAHCRRLEEEGHNSFSHYQMPQAILKFRQGFGRLIRTQKDRGMVLVLDSRIYHKTYGKEFLDALPRCRRRAGRLAGLVQDAYHWLGRSD